MICNHVAQLSWAERFVHDRHQVPALDQLLRVQFHSFCSAKDRAWSLHAGGILESLKQFQSRANRHLKVGDQKIDASLNQTFVAKLTVVGRFDYESSSSDRKAHDPPKDGVVFYDQNGRSG